MIALFLSDIFTAVDSLVFLPRYSIIIKFKLHNSGYGLSANAAYTPIDLFADTAAILISIVSEDIMGCSGGKLICICPLGIP